MKKLIFLDPGHGGTDPGALGKKRTKESMVN
jgi:N-acetylmuramoyl-L-alanine amidase